MVKKIFLFSLLFLNVLSSGYSAGKKPTIENELTAAPPFSKQQEWIQGEQHGAKVFKDKTTLVYFFDYATINSIREISVLKKWFENYKSFSFQIIFIHAPEFEFAYQKENVLESVKRYNIPFPVALDNDGSLWKAYENRSWPTKHLVDAKGKIAHTRVGEGGYIETETSIRESIQAMFPGVELPIYSISQEMDMFDVWECGEMSTEIYSGYKRAAWWGVEIANETKGNENQFFAYEDRGRRMERGIFLEGEWAYREEYLEHGEGSADYLGIIYLGRDVYAVLDQLKENERTKVYLFRDREPIPEDYRGSDVREDDYGNTYVWVEEPRLYYLIENEDADYHELKLLTKDSGLAVYVFSFSNRCLAEMDHVR
jgi:hypothetical protein